MQENKVFWHVYHIVICAMLCVSFLSKSKVTNVFPKHILSKTYSKINSSKEEIAFSGDSKKLLVQRFV